MFDNLVMALPLDERAPGLINTPQVDEPALARDCDVLRVLPLYFQTLEVCIYLRVIEAGDLATI